MEEKAKQVAQLLRLLANENRLLLLCALMREPMTVGKLQAHVPGITPSALSQHLTLLKTAGVLDSSKTAQNVTYSIADQRVAEVVAALKQHYCEEEPPT
jgi:DNA-binding transcriptional ArsR family regulator